MQNVGVHIIYYYYFHCNKNNYYCSTKAALEESHPIQYLHFDLNDP